MNSLAATTAMQVWFTNRRRKDKRKVSTLADSPAAAPAAVSLAGSTPATPAAPQTTPVHIPAFMQAEPLPAAEPMSALQPARPPSATKKATPKPRVTAAAAPSALPSYAAPSSASPSVAAAALPPKPIGPPGATPAGQLLPGSQGAQQQQQLRATTPTRSPSPLVTAYQQQHEHRSADEHMPHSNEPGERHSSTVSAMSCMLGSVINLGAGSGQPAYNRPAYDANAKCVQS